MGAQVLGVRGAERPAQMHGDVVPGRDLIGRVVPVGRDVAIGPGDGEDGPGSVRSRRGRWGWSGRGESPPPSRPRSGRTARATASAPPARSGRACRSRACVRRRGWSPPGRPEGRVGMHGTSPLDRPRTLVTGRKRGQGWRDDTGIRGQAFPHRRGRCDRGPCGLRPCGGGDRAADADHGAAGGHLDAADPGLRAVDRAGADAACRCGIARI
jgi:hypothetical protein